MVTTPQPLTIAEFHALLDAQPDARLELEPDGSVFEEDAADVSLGHSFLQPRLAALLDAQRRGFVFTELNIEDERPLPMPQALRGLELRCVDVFQLLEPGG